MHLCGQRGDDRGASAGDVQVAGAGQRSGIPLRRQRADAAHRGPDDCRTLAPIRAHSESGARDAALLRRHRARGRRAGAVAVPHRTEELDQGRLVAGLRGRHRRQRPVEKRLRAATPDYGWLSEESVDDRSASRQAAGLDRRSDRRHPRLSRRPRRLVRAAWRWSRMPRRCWRRCSRRPPTSSSSPCAAQGATLNGVPVRASAGARAGFRPVAGPKPLVERLSLSPMALAASANRIAGAAAVPGRRWQARRRFCRRPKPRLGPCRGQFDRARSEW